MLNLMEWSKKTFLPLGEFGLFLLAFIESSFFPIPPDILLILLSINDPSNALWYALICTLGSVLGGIFGYGIGYSGGYFLLKKLVSKEKIVKVHKLFNKYEALTMFIAAFTPIPFKVFTISAGVFYVNFKKFIVVCFLGRGLRFFLEGVLIMFFGKFIVRFLEKYFSVVSLLIVLLVVCYFIFRKKFKKFKRY